MNAEQAKSAIRWIISVSGPFLASHGFMSSEGVEMWGGLVLAIIPLVWSMLVHTQQNAVAVVDAIAKQPNSPVKGVVTESTPAGRNLANSMPGNTTVVAGTQAAKTVAKT